MSARHAGQAGRHASSQPPRQAATKTHRVTQAAAGTQPRKQAACKKTGRQAGRENPGNILSKS